MSTPGIICRSIALRGLSLLLLAGFCATSHGAPIVHWGGNYVTLGQDLALPTPTDVGTTRIWAYSGTTPISPSAGYTAPPDRSGTFYGGTYLTRSVSIVDWTRARVINEGPGNLFDQIVINRGLHATASFSGAAFFAFLTDSFLNGGGGGETVQFGLNGGIPTGSLSMEIGLAQAATFRFAVLNNGQWYLSSATATEVGEFSISSDDILASTWALWEPTGGADGRLESVPGSFDVLGSSFTDIEGFGYYIGVNGGPAEGVGGGISSFMANGMVVVPEPGVVSLLLVGAAGFFMLRSRFRLS